jgi:hypothetical protein
MTWSPYTRNRKIKICEDYSVIIPENFDEKKYTPIFCDVCEIRYSTKDDEESHKKFGCCSTCADTWAYSHKVEWEKGWRPTKNQIEISVQNRQFVSKVIQFE